MKSGIHAGPDDRGRLVVRRDVGARRKCLYGVGETELSQALARVYGLLPPVPETIAFSRLAERWDSNPDAEVLKGLVAVLDRRELVNLTLPRA